MLDTLKAETMLTPAPAAAARAAQRKAWSVEARALVALALPLVATQLAGIAVSTTDVIFLGRFSTHALAAAAIGSTFYYLAWLLGAGPGAAVSPMIAQLKGGRPKARAGVRRIVRMGLWSSILLATPLMALLFFARPILIALGQQPALAAEAGQFTSMLCFGLPFAIGFQVLRNFTVALSHPRAALWVTLATIVWNAVAGYGLIFGHFGAPRLGIIGAGLATSSSAVFGCCALAALIATHKDLAAYRLPNRFFEPAWPVLAELVRLGAPIGATMIFEAMLFNSMTLVMGTFGPASLAAHQVALSFASVTFMVPLGFGMAATVRVGLAAGAGDLHGARRAGTVAMGIGVAFVSLCAIVMLLFGRSIAELYVSGRAPADLAAITLAALFLKVAAAFQVFDALQVVGGLSLRGLKDARAPMVLAGASYWLAGAPMCIGLGVGLHMQGLGVWIGLAFGLFVAAVLMCGRFYLLTRRARIVSAIAA